METKTMKFKIGDVVKIVENNCQCDTCLGGVGKTGFIVSINGDLKDGKCFEIYSEPVSEAYPLPAKGYLGRVNKHEMKKLSKAEEALFRLRR